jgi:hypothetical protein
MVSYSKFLKILISFCVALSPVMFINSANASTLAGGSGWRVASTVVNGVGVTVNAVKDVMVNGAKKTVTGVANVTPTAGQVGKFIGKNVGAAAVVGAVDLLLDGVDWVIDEGGKVTKKPNPDPITSQYFYRIDGSLYSYTGYFDAAEKWFDYLLKKYPSSYKSFVSTQINDRCDFPSGSQSACNVRINYINASNGQAWTNVTVFKVPNPQYNPSAPLPANVPINDREGKPLTLVSLGQMVIDQAETEVKTGNPAVPIATPVTQAAATAVVGEAATDEVQARPIATELDKSAAIPTTETAVGEIAPPTTNPDTGEVKPGSISLDFPVFCSWAPSMCVLADKVQEAITDAREWVKESEETDTELEFPEQEQQETDTNINFNGSCPAKITLVNFNYHNNQQNWEVDFTEWCSAVTTYIRPIVISMGAFSAVLIVSGVRINE